MGYQSLINTLYEMTGIFKSYELTTLVMFDKQNQENNMFVGDIIGLEKDLSSLADQTIDLDNDDCKLTKGLRPQLGLKCSPTVNLSKMWQSPFLRQHVSSKFVEILEQINQA